MTNIQYLSPEEFDSYLKEILESENYEVFKKYNHTVHGIVTTSNKKHKFYDYVKVLNSNNSLLMSHHYNYILEIYCKFCNNQEKLLLKLFEQTGINFWDSLFNYISLDLELQDNVLHELKFIIQFINSNLNELNNLNNFREYFKRNKSSVKKIAANYTNNYKYNYNLNEMSILSMYERYLFIKNIAFLSCDLELWQMCIELCIEEIPPIEYFKLLKNNKWVFVNINVTNILMKITDKLSSRIKGVYIYDNSFSKFCHDSLKILDLVLNIYSINDKSKIAIVEFLKDNINKIVCIHRVTHILDKINEIDSSIFLREDSSGFLPFIDAIKYGDYKCVKWMIENVLTNIDVVTETMSTSFVSNISMQYVIENSDFRVLKEVLALFEKYPVILNIDDILYISSCAHKIPFKNFSKKLSLLFDFIDRNEKYYLYNNRNFIKDVLFDQEAFIENTNFIPIILNKLVWVNKHHYKINMDSEFQYNQLPSKNINCEDLKKIMSLTTINDMSTSKKNLYICNFLHNNIFTNKKSICFCKIKKIVILVINYVHNKTYTYEDFIEALNTLNYKTNTSIYNGAYSLIEHIYQKSLAHKCYEKNILQDKLIEMFNCIIQKTINNYTYLGTRNLYFKGIDLSFIKKLIFNCYYFNDIEYLYSKSLQYFARKTNYDLLEQIYTNYYYDKNEVELTFRNYKKQKNEYEKKNNSIYIFNKIINSKFNELNNLLNEIKKSKLKVIDYKLSNKIFDLKIQNAIDIQIINKVKKIFIRDFYNLDNIFAKFDELFINCKSIVYSVKNKEELVSKMKNYLKKMQILKDYTNNTYKKGKEILECIIFLRAIFMIKFFVKNRLSKNFKNHKSKTKDLFIAIKSKNNIVNIHEDTIEDKLLNFLETSQTEITSAKYVITAPSLLTLDRLLNNYKTHSVITQKIDGVTKHNMKITNSFPKFNLNNFFEVEYESESNVNFIIGISKSTFLDDNKFSDFVYELRESHDFAKLTKFPKKITIKDLCNPIFKELLMNEKYHFKRYLEKSKNITNIGKIFWWPKVFYNLEYSNFKEYVYMINFIKTNKEMQIFKNDGWILQNSNYINNNDICNNHLECFKIKELSLQTIDIKFVNGKWLLEDKQLTYDFEELYSLKVLPKITIKDNQIYRCYPIIQKKSGCIYENTNYNSIAEFHAKDIRSDKKCANSVLIANQIIRSIYNPLDFDKLYNSINSNQAYYTRTNTPKKSIPSHFKSEISASLQDFISEDVIDIGGGYKTFKYLNKFKNIKSCLSTDNDINIIVNNIVNQKKSDNSFQKLINYKYLDFTKLKKEYESIESQLSVNIDTKYDTITAINCINFALKNNITTEKFMNNINSFAKKGTFIIIKFMDFEAFYDKAYIVIKQHKESCQDKSKNILIRSPLDSSFINIDTNAKINKIYYEWAHDKPIEETLICKSDIINLFKENGWSFKLYKNHGEYNKKRKDITREEFIWNTYFESFSDIVFEFN